MLTYVCPTCSNKYDAKVDEKKIVYVSGNKRIVLQNEEEDCDNCMQEIKKAQEAKREEIRATKKL